MTAALQDIEAAEEWYRLAMATQSPYYWQTAARLLFKLRPQPAKPRNSTKSRGKCRRPAPVAIARFADGRRVRMAFWSQANKPIDYARGRRIVTRAYRNTISPYMCPMPMVSFSVER